MNIQDIATILLVLLAAALAYPAFIAARAFVRDYAERRQSEMLRRLVWAAEQAFPVSDGEDRLEWVLDRFAVLYPGFNEELAQDLVESFVYEMNNRQRRFTELTYKPLIGEVEQFNAD